MKKFFSRTRRRAAHLCIKREREAQLQEKTFLTLDQSEEHAVLGIMKKKFSSDPVIDRVNNVV